MTDILNKIEGNQFQLKRNIGCRGERRLVIEDSTERALQLIRQSFHDILHDFKESLIIINEGIVTLDQLDQMRASHPRKRMEDIRLYNEGGIKMTSYIDQRRRQRDDDLNDRIINWDFSGQSDGMNSSAATL